MLAYIAGKPEAFTSQDHNFCAGETIEKQLIVINNSRSTVTANCQWALGLPDPVQGKQSVTLATGQQQRIALRFTLPEQLDQNSVELAATVAFDTGEIQKDSFTIDILPHTTPPDLRTKIALFDPQGETQKVLDKLGMSYQKVDATSDLSQYELLVVGKKAISIAGSVPDVARVRDGLKVLLFEQTADTLEKRFGFRVATYGLRSVFQRISDHPALEGIGAEHLRNWCGEATLLPKRLDYKLSPEFNYAPTTRWCGILVSRLWRCGCRGNVASVLIEKPARGDFLPLLDGGYSLQYSPLMEYREGNGMILFCQMDVTGRTEDDPAAERLAETCSLTGTKWKPTPRRRATYVGNRAGKRHLESMGIEPRAYEPDTLSDRDVLVIGAGAILSADDSREITDWLSTGGHALALGLDEHQAKPILSSVEMDTQEHIASYIELQQMNSPLVGIGPADVHNAAPRKIPLITAGANVFGNGVLAKAHDANVVFFQLPPFDVSRAQGMAPSLTISAEDAVAGRQSALLTMGTVALGQFGQRVEAGEIGKTYTFAVFVKSEDGQARRDWKSNVLQVLGIEWCVAPIHRSAPNNGRNCM